MEADAVSACNTFVFDETAPVVPLVFVPKSVPLGSPVLPSIVSIRTSIVGEPDAVPPLKPT
jgi:hypothetical protein